jgi:Uma2 family endonuclease
MESVSTLPRTTTLFVAESEDTVEEITPQPLRWTREQYMKLYDQGFFQGRRVERIEGVITEMSPIGPRHRTGVTLASYALDAAFGPGYFVSAQNSFAADEESDPEPDILIVRGSIRDYADVHLTPEVAVLIVEVSDKTLSYDRQVKSSLYARAGLEDYWILCVQEKRRFLEVRRRPVQDPDAPFGWSYAQVSVYLAGDKVAPLARPDAEVAVADLLP